MSKNCLGLRPLNPDSPVPLYYQLQSDLREKILSGDLPQGQLLPSETDLAGRLGVSRITVKRAVNELAKDGLVHRQRGRGTTVLLNTAMTASGRFTHLLDTVRRWRTLTRCIEIEAQFKTAPQDIAHKLKLKPDAPAFSYRYVLMTKDQPFSYVEGWFSQAVHAVIQDYDLSQEPLISAIERAGLKPVAADQLIRADSASAQDAAHLGLDPGAPVFVIENTSENHRGEPLLFIRSSFPPDIYQYRLRVSDY